MVKGGGLNFSFAQFTPSLVVYKQIGPTPWTGGLEWQAERVKPWDFRYFDYALVNGDEDVHNYVVRQAQLAPVTNSGSWRLYRISEPTRSLAASGASGAPGEGRAQ